MNQPHQAQLEAAMALLQETELKLEKTLEGDELALTRVGMMQGVRALTNRLAFMTGNNPIAQASEAAPHLGEMTTMFGESLERKPAAAIAAIQPDETAKEAIRARVTALLERFDETPTDEILMGSVEPDGELILRGAAKQSGVESWQDAPVDVPFVEAIRTARAEAATAAEREAEAERMAQVAQGAGAATGEKVFGEVAKDKVDGQAGTTSTTTAPATGGRAKK